jgi:hypothetical protein
MVIFSETSSTGAPRLLLDLRACPRVCPDALYITYDRLNLVEKTSMKGRHDAAFRHLSKASRLASDNLVIRMYYAAALWTSGKSAEAIELMRTLMDLDSPPEVELEANALFLIAEPRSEAKVTARMRQLLADGIRGSGIALRAMVSNRPYAGRRDAERLEVIIQGRAAIPGDWQ